MPYAPGIRAVLDPTTQSGIGPLSVRVFGVGAAVLATIPVPEAVAGSAIYYLSAVSTAAALVVANLPAGAYEPALYSLAGAHVADASLGWTGSAEYDPSAGTAVEVSAGTTVEVVAGPSPLTVDPQGRPIVSPQGLAAVYQVTPADQYPTSEGV